MKNRVVEGTVRLLDILCVVAAVPAAYWLRDLWPVHTRGPLVALSEYWPFLALTLLAWVAAAWFFRLYESFRTRSVWPELGRIAKALVAVALIHIAVIFFLRQHEDVSRLFFTTYFAVAFSLLAANRLVLRSVAHSARRGGLNMPVFAVVGSGDLARDVVSHGRGPPEWGLHFAGNIILDEEESTSTPCRARARKVSQLGQILDDNVIDEVIFAVPRERLASWRRRSASARSRGPAPGSASTSSTSPAPTSRSASSTGCPCSPSTARPPTRSPCSSSGPSTWSRAPRPSSHSRRCSSPRRWPCKLESPGPVFFRQVRVGKNGRPFRMYKFRSMHIDAEARLESLRAQNEASGPVFKMKNDPRVTRVGRFIRRTSIDELPQFLNVLFGEMSVVGPRPPVPAEVRQYQRWQRRRLSVKPGITCTWQVSGRSNISFDQWMKLDLEYIDTWSLWQDIRICFRTVPAVLLSRGAH